MATALTTRQSEILTLIQQSLSETGYPPTRAEIARQMGFKSTNASEDHLRALEKKGFIELTPGASRGIRLTKTLNRTQPPSSTITRLKDTAQDVLEKLTLPIIGRVAAGSPVLAQENIDRELAVDTGLFDIRPDYLLQVKGMSMRDIGILDGDLLAVKRTQEAREGSIVVARIDDDVTVKRLSRQNGRIVLLAENPDFEPIHIRPGENLTIEGLAVGLIRTQALH